MGDRKAPTTPSTGLKPQPPPRPPVPESQIDQLRRERDEALALLRDITDDVSPWDVTYGLQGSCQICGGDRHDDDCPWVAARKLLERTER